MTLWTPWKESTGYTNTKIVGQMDSFEEDLTSFYHGVHNDKMMSNGLERSQ